MNRAVVQSGLLVAGVMLMLLAMVPAGIPQTYATELFQATAPTQRPTRDVGKSEPAPEAVDTPGTPLPPEDTAQPTPTQPVTTTVTPTAIPTFIPTSPGGATITPTLTSVVPGVTTPTIRRIPVNDDGDDDRGGGGGGGGDGGDDGGDVSIVKTVSPSTATTGDTLEFVITVSNEGGRSDDIVVVDTIGDEFEIVDATTTWGDIEVVDNEVRVTIGPLFDDDTVVIRIVVIVDCEPDEDRTANQLDQEKSNTARVSTTSDDDDSDNNESTVSVVCQVPLTPTPSASPTPSPSPMATLTPLPRPTITGTPIPAILPETGSANHAGSVALPRLVLLLVGLTLIVLGLSLRLPRTRER